jgi:hypothetical protein
MTATVPSSPLTIDQPLVVLIRAEDRAAVLAREPVSRADLADVISETWRDACLRAGHPAMSLAETPMRLIPQLADPAGARCVGLGLEVTLPDGRSTRRDFTVFCLRHVAERMVAPLLEAEVLKPGQSYAFEVVLDSHGVPTRSAGESTVPLTVSLQSPPLTYLRQPVRLLLEQSVPVAIQDDEEFPVFYTQEAFDQAERCARRGGDLNPPVETGGVLLGSLAACPVSGELAAIITDVIEVQAAEETTFSLSYSGQSWMRIQAILKARQAAYPRQATRLLGQGHGHSFLPNDGQVCAECAKRSTCNLTSVFVSPDDRNWHRSVFVRQPWALCHIFGLTARGDRVNQLYGLKDGRLQARGYYLLPDFAFDP